MSLPVEKLTKESGIGDIREAIDQSISFLMRREGKTMKDAAGQAYETARDLTGKEMQHG